MEELEGQRLNLDKPRWEQNTYLGRVRHFFVTTNPINILRTSKDLEQAKDIVTRYRAGEKVDLPTDEIWRAKHIYDSAFHPDTGEKMVIIGRMAAQVPMCSLIGGCMLTFYKTPKEVIFWQWFNQSFNAIVNYTNRSGSSPISPTQLGFSYVCATSGAVAAALSLNSLVKKAPPLIGRFVPLAAIAVANCINIPLMRMQELTDGIPVVDNNGNELGNSKIAAQSGIAAVTVSRVALGSGTLVFAPVAMNYLEKRGVLRRFRWASLPIQMMMIGLSYTFATPMCCALFPQQASIKVSNLEGELQRFVSYKWLEYVAGLIILPLIIQLILWYCGLPPISPTAVIAYLTAPPGKNLQIFLINYILSYISFFAGFVHAAYFIRKWCIQFVTFMVEGGHARAMNL